MSKKAPAISLTSLATEANDQHKQCTDYAQQVVDLAKKTLLCARAAGDALRKAKKALQHGKWLPWIEQNLEFSPETAQLYMKVARRWSKLEAAVEAGEILSLRDARKFLSPPGEAPPGTEKPGAWNVSDIFSKLDLLKYGLASRERCLVEAFKYFHFANKQVRTYNGNVACQILSPLAITGDIDGRKLLEMLKLLGDYPLQFAEENRQLIIKTSRGDKRTVFNIQTTTETFDDFEPPTGKWKKLPDPEEFVEAIRIAGLCAGRDDSKFELTCLHICPKYIEAFDAYQGCRYYVKTGLKQSILIRKVDIQWFPAPCKSGLGEFNLTANWIHFRNKAEQYIYSVRHYPDKSEEDSQQSKYPNLDKIFHEPGDDLHIPKKPLRKAITRAAVFAKDNPRQEGMVEISLQPKRLRIRGRDDTGRHTETIKIKYDGQDLRFYVHLKLLTELAKRTNEYRITAADISMLATKNDDFIFVTAVTALNAPPSKGKAKKKQKRISQSEQATSE